MVGGRDLTSTVESGLGIYYLLVAGTNIFYGLLCQTRFQKKTQAFVWYAVGVFFALLGVLYLLHAGPALPLWYKNLSDQGVAYSMTRGGLDPGVASAVGWVGFGLLLLAVIGGFGDLLWSYVISPRLQKPGNANGAAATTPPANGNGGIRAVLEDPGQRLVAWLVLITLLALLFYGTNAISYFVASIAGFAAFIVWRKTLTQPAIIWGIFNAVLLFGGLSMTDYDFRTIIIKPDNVPIVGMVFVVGFFTWLAFRKAVINDDRIARGLPPTEKEDDEKVLVWPDLVYTELICMVVVTIILVIWSVALPAPLEQPASSTKTPNPSKAPWYFLGLQEMLVYYDPWLAGVVFPTMIIIGLMALPYIDFNQKGNGYFTFVQRPFAIVNFLFGFIVLWVTLIFLGTFLRGPNWNFFGLYEPWDPHKLVPLNNVNLSEYFWLRGLGIWWDDPSGGVSLWRILMRESPGILLVLAYFFILPPILAKTIFRGMFIKMGFIRYMTMVTLLLFMAALPIKMILRWTLNLKYIVAIPEYFFNI